MLMQITVNPGIYGICDKIWVSMLKFFNCYQIAQLNCKFKRLAVSPQVHELLEKIMPTIVEKFFSH